MESRNTANLKEQLEAEHERIKKKRKIILFIACLPFAVPLFRLLTELLATTTDDVAGFLDVILRYFVLCIPINILNWVLVFFFGEKKEFKEIELQLKQVEVAEYIFRPQGMSLEDTQAQLPKQQPRVELSKANSKFCASCGTKVDNENLFCAKCGHPLK